MKMETLSNLDKFLEERREQIPKLREEGQKVVGYLCCKTPVEIIHALGLIPIRLGVADEAKMATGKEYIHQFTCPYIKCVVGEMLEEGDFFHDNVDVLSGYVTCLAVHRCLEVLKLYTGKPTFYLTHPLNPPKEREMKFYQGEISLFVSQLEKVAEKPLDPTLLRNSVNLFNSTRERLKKLYKLQCFNGLEIKWSDVFRLINAGFLLDPNRYLALLEEAIREVETAKINAGSQDKSPRIMLMGSPILPGDNLLVEAIEEAGAKIVADTLCTGLRTFEDLMVSEPTVASIWQTYLFSNPCATAQDLSLEEDRRLNHILRLIREYQVQGVVYYALRFCDHYAFKDDETKDFLAEKAGVPLIAIHSEYGESEVGRLRTRIEGFLETLR